MRVRRRQPSYDGGPPAGQVHPLDRPAERPRVLAAELESAEQVDRVADDGHRRVAHGLWESGDQAEASLVGRREDRVQRPGPIEAGGHHDLVADRSRG